MNKYWVQYNVSTYSQSFANGNTFVVSMFVTTDDLEQWCKECGLTPKDIVNVVKL